MAESERRESRICRMEAMLSSTPRGSAADTENNNNAVLVEGTGTERSYPDKQVAGWLKVQESNL